MSAPRPRRGSHVLEHEPPFGRNLERSQITQILTVDVPPSKDVHDVAHNGRCVPFPSDGQETDAFEFGPFSTGNVVRPRVVVVELAVRSAKEQDAVLVGDADVARSGAGRFVDGRDSVPARPFLRFDCKCARNVFDWISNLPRGEGLKEQVVGKD